MRRWFFEKIKKPDHYIFGEVAHAMREVERMSVTNAGALLKIWTLRMRMQEDGKTHPSDAGRHLAKLLVETSSKLDTSEAIEIVAAEGDKLPAKFVRVATGDILAEVRDQA